MTVPNRLHINIGDPVKWGQEQYGLGCKIQYTSSDECTKLWCCLQTWLSCIRGRLGIAPLVFLKWEEVNIWVDCNLNQFSKNIHAPKDIKLNTSRHARGLEIDNRWPHWSIIWGSCNLDAQSANRLSFPGRYLAVMRKLYDADNQNKIRKKAIICVFLVLPLLIIATAAWLSHKTRMRLFCHCGAQRRAASTMHRHSL